MVNSFSFSDEESSELVRVLGRVDVVSESEVDVVVVDRHVALASALELEDELLEVDNVLKVKKWAYVFFLACDIFEVNKAFFKFVDLVVVVLNDLGGAVELVSQGIAVVGSGREAVVGVLQLAVDVFLDAKQLLQSDDMVPELDVLFLQRMVVILELVELALQIPDSLVGSGEVILVLPLHGLDVSGSLDDISLHLLDLVLEGLVRRSDLVQIVQNSVSLVLD